MGKVAEMRVIVGDKKGPDRAQDRAQDRAHEVRAEEVRILEALLFAAATPLDEKTLASRLPAGTDVRSVLQQLQGDYAPRGVNLVRVGGKWSLRTATDLAWLLTHESVATRKLSRAAIETLAIVAYHQPVTRAEVEEIRGVSTSKGTLDVLLETGWIRLRGRRKAPGRPVTYGTSETFLSHFGLDALGDLVHTLPTIPALRAGSTSSRARASSTRQCLPILPSRSPPMIRRCAMTKSRLGRRTSISAWLHGSSAPRNKSRSLG